MFLGISDYNEIVGIKNSNKFKSQLQDIANNCQPPIKIIISEYKNMLIVTIKDGEDKPYKCTTGFYTRVGPNSQKLTRN
ncbi:MAG: hypothetical protein GY757_21580, partial [bacterium]|nr:hypothetical protein [bacterium]